MAAKMLHVWYQMKMASYQLRAHLTNLATNYGDRQGDLLYYFHSYLPS